MTIQSCMLAPRQQNYPPLNMMSSSIDEVREKLAVMRKFESTTYKPKDYLVVQQQQQPHQQKPSFCLSEGRSRQRRSTVEYLYQVVDFGGFQRDVVAYGMTHLMDRYLATSLGKQALLDRNHYQLVALTCLYMSIKLLEPQNIGVDSLVPLANGVYSRDNFLQMERTILKALDWCISQGPTPLAFVQLLMPLVVSVSTNTNTNTNTNRNLHMNTIMALYNHVQYQLELGVSDYHVCTISKPSELAIAALWNGLESMGLSLKEQTHIQRMVLDALQYHHAPQQHPSLSSSSSPIHLECRLANLQARLRHLLLAAYSFTNTSAAATTTTTATTSNSLKTGNPQQQANDSASPVSIIRKETKTAEEPDVSSSSGHDSINHVAEVDWLQYT